MPTWNFIDVKYTNVKRNVSLEKKGGRYQIDIKLMAENLCCLQNTTLKTNHIITLQWVYRVLVSKQSIYFKVELSNFA